MLTRTLHALIFVLAVLCGIVVLVRAPVFENEKTPIEVSQTQDRQRSDSFVSGILSRLNLFPSLRRPVPIAVMIENHEDARPHHRGLTDALMIQEFLVEGFISRFVAIVDANRLPREIGPVRSLRPYFLDGIYPWTRVVFHAGGSPEALDRVQNGTEFFARNLLYFDDEHGSLRDSDVAPPHNLFLQSAFLSRLLSEVPERFLQSVSWPPFPVGMPEDPGLPAQSVRVNFFSSLHNVLFEYLPLAEKYRRTNGEAVSHARPSTIVILEVPIDSTGEYGRLFMDLTGTGRAQVLHSGRMWEGRWSRGSLQEQFTISGSDGEEIPIKKGLMWIMTLPTLERVSVETVEELEEL